MGLLKSPSLFISKISSPGLALICLIFALTIGLSIGDGQMDLAITQIQLMVFIGLAIAIMIKPFLGIVLILASLPVIDILPSSSILSSTILLVGGVTLGGFLLNRYILNREKSFDIPSIIWVAIFFSAWVLLSNPAAALLPGNNDRYWLFTFTQLIVLAWLASQLLDTPQKHQILMWAFSIVTVISATYAIQQGGIEETINESVRAGGLAGGANTAARYFVVGLIFSYYLIGKTNNRFFRAVLIIGIAINALGVIMTVSRTGLLLLCATIGMLLVLRIEGKNQIRAVILLIIFLSAIWFYSDNLIGVVRSIIPSIQQGTDTMGLRYRLWEAGFRMFNENIFRGVGIGMYTERLIFYGNDLLPYYRLRLGAHNMYIQVLAETGLIGILLFASFLGSAILSFWRSIQTSKPELSVLVKTWFMVFVVMLLGGITKHDHYDKLLWITAGISMCSLWKPSDDVDAESTY